MDALAYIAIGSNLANPLNQVLTAFNEIAMMPKSKLLKKSSCYSSLPLGYKNQPDFINAVVLIETELSPRELLSELQMIEHLHKRALISQCTKNNRFRYPSLWRCKNK